MCLTSLGLFGGICGVIFRMGQLVKSTENVAKKLDDLTEEVRNLSHGHNDLRDRVTRLEAKNE